MHVIYYKPHLSRQHTQLSPTTHFESLSAFKYPGCVSQQELTRPLTEEEMWLLIGDVDLPVTLKNRQRSSGESNLNLCHITTLEEVRQSTYWMCGGNCLRACAAQSVANLFAKWTFVLLLNTQVWTSYHVLFSSNLLLIILIINSHQFSADLW